MGDFDPVCVGGGCYVVFAYFYRSDDGEEQKGAECEIRLNK